MIINKVIIPQSNVTLCDICYPV